MVNDIPDKCQILVVGGGPGGSYAASALAREGFDVVVFEASKFPRYHIGESMLPSLRPFLRFIDAEEKIVKHGFAVKRGAAVKFNQYKREGYTDFLALDANNGAWNVVRSEFDELLLNHSGAGGAKVFQETKVTGIEFAPPTPPATPPPHFLDRVLGGLSLSGSRSSSSSDSKKKEEGNSNSNPNLSELHPIAARYTTVSGTSGTIAFEYLVDASGRNGLMSTKYLHNRRMNSSLKNIACWGYWKDGGVYMPGTSRENAPYFQALTDESGWAWFIPLHNGTTSVGIVMDSSVSTARKASGSARAKSSDSSFSLTDHYLEVLTQNAPTLFETLLANASLVKPADGSPAVKSATDFSYNASRYAGPNYRIVGDAAAFIDPFFSSGVHLALTGALSAAASIASSLRGEVPEEECARYHDAKVGISYTRFLLVVMGAYKQIRNQSAAVLADVDEDNFDRAFNIIRPIIQGAVDTGKKLTENELQQTMDFCKHVLVSPTDPEMYESVQKRVDGTLLCADGKVMMPDQVAQEFEGDEEAQYVIREVNARKPIHIMYGGTGNFESEEVEGFKVRCQRGKLGLLVY